MASAQHHEIVGWDESVEFELGWPTTFVSESRDAGFAGADKQFIEGKREEFESISIWEKHHPRAIPNTAELLKASLWDPKAVLFNFATWGAVLLIIGIGCEWLCYRRAAGK